MTNEGSLNEISGSSGESGASSMDSTSDSSDASVNAGAAGGMTEPAFNLNFKGGTFITSSFGSLTG